MKILESKFRELQKYWYKLLEEAGFKDIEKLVNGKLVLKQTATHDFWDIDPLDCEIREEYFRLISHKVNDEATLYRNAIDKNIMQMHAEGIKISAIISHLKIKGETRSRASVRYIIRKYEMTWNIKYHTSKQLNQKSS